MASCRLATSSSDIAFILIDSSFQPKRPSSAWFRAKYGTHPRAEAMISTGIRSMRLLSMPNLFFLVFATAGFAKEIASQLRFLEERSPVELEYFGDDLLSHSYAAKTWRNRDGLDAAE